MRRRRTSVNEQERLARAACEQICIRAFQEIRAAAFRRDASGAPTEFEGDFAEWIRLLADLCDGLARPRPTAVEALAYRRSVWNPAQTLWVDDVLSLPRPWKS